MMTEKQIYRRMNEVYEVVYGNRDEDEWYGDEPKIWRFRRPSEKTTYKMVFDEDCRKIEFYEKKDEKIEYRKTHTAYKV